MTSGGSGTASSPLPLHPESEPCSASSIRRVAGVRSRCSLASRCSRSSSCNWRRADRTRSLPATAACRAEQLASIRHNMGLDGPPHEQLLAWLTQHLPGRPRRLLQPVPPRLAGDRRGLPEHGPPHGRGLLISLVCRARLRHPGRAPAVRHLRQRHLVPQLLRSGDAGLLVRSDAAAPLRGPARLAALGRDVQSPTAAACRICSAIWSLPAFTIAIGSIAGWSRYVRSSTLEQLSPGLRPHRPLQGL